MTDYEKEIIDRIKYQMKIKGFTQTKLGKSLGLEQYHVCRVLAGKPFPSIDQLHTMANCFGCSIEYLLGLKEESSSDLSKDAAEVARAYLDSDDVVKDIVKRVLSI